MEDRIKGIHHITAIAGAAKRNVDFYTKVLGLRLIKKTVNFDDPQTYHFYYGDETGTPGSILTFFPWEGIQTGRRGTGQATEIGYAVPNGSLDYWVKRFEEHHVTYNKVAEKFGERYLTFLDPDGLKFELVEAEEGDLRKGFVTKDIGEEFAIKGFQKITITLASVAPTAAVLTDILGYKLEATEVNRFRYRTDASPTANIVDLVQVPGDQRGFNGGGTVHHVAFRVANEEILMKYRQKVEDAGLHITPKIDRNYFFSLYFREPGGVLFEIATENPGFAVDEPVDSLGTHLKLPAQYESRRSELEKVLPKLD